MLKKLNKTFTFIQPPLLKTKNYDMVKFRIKGPQSF